MSSYNFIADFESYADRIAISSDNSSYTYTELVERINYWEKEFIKISEDTVVGLEGDFTFETISMLFALISKKAIIVPLDIKQREKNKKKYDIAQIKVLITVYNESSIDITRINSNPDNLLYSKIKEEKASGLVLFTSGSSGNPKGAVHNFSKLLQKFQTKRKALKTINFLLFDHWGGLNTLFHILSNGGTVITLKERGPDYVCGLIEKHRVELLPTSPSFLNLLLLSRAYERFDLSSLSIISYGSEPMPESILKRLNTIFPDVSLRQTYGLIELGVMRSKSESNDSLWVKLGGEGFNCRVVDNILQIKSDSAMLGYLNAPSPFTEDGWFITGDSVEVKGEYYRILGRKSELINVGGEKVFPQEVENTIIQLDQVSDVTVFGAKNPLVGNIVCAKVQIEGDFDKKDMIMKIRNFCEERLEKFKVPVKITFSTETQFNSRLKKDRKNLSK